MCVRAHDRHSPEWWSAGQQGRVAMFNHSSHTHIACEMKTLFFADLHSNLESIKREISSFAASTAEKSFHFIIVDCCCCLPSAKRLFSTTHRTCISPSEEEVSRDDNESLNNTVFFICTADYERVVCGRKRRKKKSLNFISIPCMPKINNKYRRLYRLHVDVYAGLWDSPARWNEPDGRGEEKKCCEMGTEWQILRSWEGRRYAAEFEWKNRHQSELPSHHRPHLRRLNWVRLLHVYAFSIHHSILFTYHTVMYPLTPEVSSVFNFPHMRNVRHSSHNIHRHKTRNNITMSSPL